MSEFDVRRLAYSLYEDTPTAILLYDREGRLTAANAAARRLLGAAYERFLGRSYAAHVQRRDRRRVTAAFRTALAGGHDTVEIDVPRADGRTVPLECDLFPARKDGAIVGVFVQAYDLVALRSAEAALGLNQERFRSLFEYHPDPIMELKDDGTISRVNVALESKTGLYGERLVGKPWIDLLDPDDRHACEGALRDALRGEATELDARLLDRMGNRLDVQLKLVPLRAEDQVRGAYAIAKDVTVQRRAERALAAQNERLRKLYVAAAEAGISHDEQIEATLALGLELFDFEYGYVTRFAGDRAVVEYAVGLGTEIRRGMVFPMEAALSRHLRADREVLFIPDLDVEPWASDPARETRPWRSYFAVQLRVGGRVYGGLIFAARRPRPGGLEEGDRELLHLAALFVAAALERAVHEERIEQLAFNDILTGLPNRVLFEDRIRQALASAKRYNRGFAVMFLDLDRFKEINDAHGHAVGDEVLQAVARRLRGVLRESDTIARIGGDEFVVLQPIADGPADAADLARKLLGALQEPVVAGGQSFSVRTSIGIALYPQDAQGVEELLEAADRALYRAKHAGRNRWFFAEDVTARSAWPQPAVKSRAAGRTVAPSRRR